jgi:hypothetical protein
MITPPISLRGDSLQGSGNNFATPELAQILVSPRMSTQVPGAGLSSFPSAPYNTTNFMEHDIIGAVDAGPLAPLNVTPGSDDSRQNVIKKGIIDARDAVILLN